MVNTEKELKAHACAGGNEMRGKHTKANWEAH